MIEMRAYTSLTRCAVFKGGRPPARRLTQGGLPPNEGFPRAPDQRSQALDPALIEGV